MKVLFDQPDVNNKTVYMDENKLGGRVVGPFMECDNKG